MREPTGKQRADLRHRIHVGLERERLKDAPSPMLSRQVLRARERKVWKIENRPGPTVLRVYTDDEGNPIGRYTPPRDRRNLRLRDVSDKLFTGSQTYAEAGLELNYHATKGYRVRRNP